MIYDNDTKTLILTTLDNLKQVNNELNDKLNTLNGSIYSDDRETIRAIQNKNIETIQLIQKMELKGWI